MVLSSGSQASSLCQAQAGIIEETLTPCDATTAELYNTCRDGKAIQVKVHSTWQAKY